MPDQTKSEPMSFTPDGDELFGAGPPNATEALHASGDCRLIRRQLGDLGLDWATPSPAGRNPQGAEATRLPAKKVEFVGADLVTDPQKLREYRKASHLLALRANPFDAWAHFSLGQMIEDTEPAGACPLHCPRRFSAGPTPGL